MVVADGVDVVVDAAVPARGSDRKRGATTLQGKSEQQRMQLRMIQQAFDRFDLNGDGWVTAGEVRTVFRQMGRDCSDRAVTKWIRDRDIDQDGMVSFAKFRCPYS